MYWESFNDKYGFENGEAIPPDAERVREVYVTLINHKAQLLGSQFRVVGFNRMTKNLYVIHKVPLSFFETVTPQQLSDGLDGLPDHILDAGDDKLEEAISWAQDQQPETFVETTVIVQHNELNKLLAEDKKESHNEEKPK